MLIVGIKWACSLDQPKTSSFSALALGIQLMLKIAGIENVNQIIIQSAGSPKLRFEDDGEFVGNTNKPAPLVEKGQNGPVVLTNQPSTFTPYPLHLPLTPLEKIN